MTDQEYEELLTYHVKRAKEKDYEALTVETKVIERALELYRQFSDGHRANKES